ncbi:MAG: TIGR02597 family protein [Verrucomicrobiota bacterium]
MRVIFQKSALIAFGLGCGSLGAQETASTPPVGGMRLELPAKKSSLLSVPVLKPTTAIGRVVHVSDNGATLSNVNWTIGQFRPTAATSYYLEFTTGELAGVSAKIVDNTATSVELEPGTYTLTAHPLGVIAKDVFDSNFNQTGFGDVAIIRAFWTLGEVLGATDSEVQIAPFATLASAHRRNPGDRVYIPGAGDNSWEKLAQTPLFYVQGSGWRQTGQAATDRQGELLPPGKPWLVVRQSAQSSTLIVVGNIQLTRAVTHIPPGNGRDVLIASRFPEPIDLTGSGLYFADPIKRALVPSSSLGARGDEYYTFEVQPGTPYLEPAHRYLWVTGLGWREPGQDEEMGPAIALKPGLGGMLRLRASNPGGFWLQVPPQ